MNLLLDTHVAIWFITDDKNLPSTIKKVIENSLNNCFISIASFWELSIKYSLGKLEIDNSLEEIFNTFEESGFETLPINKADILESARLPFYHRDPFDRIIIAQSASYKLKIITKDAQFNNYPIQLLWE